MLWRHRPVDLDALYWPDPGDRMQDQPAPEPVIAEHDIEIPRPDLGPGAATVVRAGFEIPAHLVDLVPAPKLHRRSKQAETS